MIRTKRTPGKKMITDINITPFTDVCLVLLIIFMVTASTLTKESSLRINLPKAAAHDAALPGSVTVYITRDRQILLNGEKIAFAELGQKIRQYHEKTGTDLLVVKGDEDIPYKLVIATIDTARKVGVSQIALATRQPNGSVSLTRP